MRWNKVGRHSLQKWGLSSYTSLCLSCARKQPHPLSSLLWQATDQAREFGGCCLLGGGGGEQAAFTSFPSRSLPILRALQCDWGLGASQPASQPWEHRACWEAVGREGELLGQGREVRKGERQMGKQRECQGEGCSWQGWVAMAVPRPSQADA